MIAAVRPTVTKNGRSAGKKMAMLTVEDLTGKCDAVVFSETYEQLRRPAGAGGDGLPHRHGGPPPRAAQHHRR